MAARSLTSHPPGRDATRFWRDSCTPRDADGAGLAPAVTTHSYYNDAWQLLEVQSEAGQTAEQTIYDLRYIDAAAVQFRDANNDGTLDQTLTFLHDGNYNVTAVLDAAAGNILERYSYDAYGQHTVHDAAWSLVGTTSTIGNHLLYAGYQFDSDTGLHLARNRYFHSSLGSWLTRDPLGYVDGMNVYQYVGGNAVNASDPMGLFTIQGMLDAYEHIYGREEMAKWWGLATLHHLDVFKIEMCSNWWVEDRAIFISNNWWGMERSNESAARTLREALAQHFKVVERDWAVFAADLTKAAVKIAAGAYSTATGLALLPVTGGLSAGLVFFGLSSIGEGATQVAGLGAGRQGINVGQEIAGTIAGNNGRVTYQLLDIGIGVFGAGIGAVKMSQVPRFHIVEKVTRVRLHGQLVNRFSYSERMNPMGVIVSNAAFVPEITTQSVGVVLDASSATLTAMPSPDP